ncbi:MAG TPA: phage holin family protein [Candidatus Binatia bacterium]|nr:phage holin family protein [Candidatus Binatia bacterium]
MGPAVMPNGNTEHLSLSHALERVIQKGQQAFFAQFQLLRVEAEEDVTHTLEGAGLLFAGLAVLACAWIAFIVLAVHLLRQPLSLASALAIVGSLNLGLGAWLILTSIRTLRSIRLMRPDAEPIEVPATNGATLSIPEQRELVKPAVEQTEEELKQGIDELMATINSRLDFGQRIVDHPVPWLAGSLLVGFMLGHPRAR